jgi:hypothetical protein
VYLEKEAKEIESAEHLENSCTLLSIMHKVFTQIIGPPVVYFISRHAVD